MSKSSPRCSTERGRSFGLALLVVGGLVGGPLAAAPRSPVTTDSRYQTELPLAGQHLAGNGASRRPAPGGQAPSRAVAPEGREDSGGGSGLGDLPSGLAPGVGWLLIAAFLVTLVVVTARVLLGRSADPEVALPKPEPAEEPGNRDKTPVVLADRLAAEGRWAEALQALLGDVLARLSERFRVPLPPARTTREALRALPLQGDPREALATWVATEERALFGRQPVGPADYDRGL
ncbi:MAG: DUF4129 domain-containing protein [Thermoanaerobaculia bacterium]|nr:DUF4129 domain-containing protein [Thermoanaerobaculia bacterium]